MTIKALVQRSLVGLGSAKSPDFVVLEGKLQLSIFRTRWRKFVTCVLFWKNNLFFFFALTSNTPITNRRECGETNSPNA